jgi:hypothetical protein
LVGSARPAAPINRRGGANEIGDVRSSSLSRDGKALSGSSGFDGVRAREGREDVEYDVDGREWWYAGRGGVSQCASSKSSASRGTRWSSYLLSEGAWFSCCQFWFS